MKKSVFALAIGAALLNSSISGCSSPFSDCFASRTCTAGGSAGSSADSAGAAGDFSNSESSGAAGLADMAGASTGASSGAASETAGAPSEAGASGESSNPTAGSGGVGGAGTLPLMDGVTCQANAECANQHCVDGVCCNSACVGCNACSNALTGQDNGKCSPVVGGQDPHAACADETASNECGNDGTCDGKGTCSKVGSSHVCKAAACSSDGKSFISATTCNRDGSGTCTSTAPQDCAGFPCTASGCAKPCTTNTDCSAANYCESTSGKCVTRKSDGSGASNTYECTSGFVADGVCCNAACTGQCQSCKQTPGVCKAVTTPRAACGGSGTCGTLKCDGTRADCVSPGNEVSCPSTCSGDLTAKITSTCNGSGACGTAQSTSCGSQYCKSGGCVNKLGNNTGGCTTSTVCTSGNCSTSPSAGTMCCAAGSDNCSQGCYNLLSDAKHCGSCATVCGANKACSSGSCTCSGGSKLSCGTCPSWDFESNTTEGWVSNSLANVAVFPAARPTPSGAPFSGSSSLAFTVNNVGPGPQGAGVTVPLCANSVTSADVTGLSFYLYLDGPTYPISKYEYAFASGDLYRNGINFLNLGDQFASKQWLLISRNFLSVPAARLEFYFQPNGDWSGTIYIDQVQLTH